MVLLDLHALAALVPRGYRLTLALENVSADGALTAAVPATSSVSVVSASAEGGFVLRSSDAPSAPRNAGSDAPLLDDTPLGIARRIAAEEPTLELTADAWAKRLGYSARELRRARRVPGALPWRRRGTGGGKAGRGLVIKARDVQRYLEVMRDVATGLVDPPAWYERVADQRKT